MQDQPIKFSSFFWAGYECTYALNEVPERIDMLAASMHDKYCREDYQLLKQQGITTVREGLSWSQIDKGNDEYDFSRFEAMMKIGQEEGIQQIWDLNHFDFPEHLDVLSENFVEQFATYAQKALTIIRKYQTGTLYITPINEISFFTWIGADRGVWAPYLKGRNKGHQFKKQLVRACLAAMKAIWAEDNDVHFIHADPFMRRLAVQPANKKAVTHVNEFNDVIRFEAWDMISGKSCPELGGEPKYLDIVGINYYYHNQEFVFSEGSSKITYQAMEWDSDSRVPFWEMLQEIHQRYDRPMVISETGSFDDQRQEWWKRTLAEVDEGVQKGLPIYGVCAYPVIDRPDSVNYLLRRSGLWDFADHDLQCARIPHQPSLDVIKEYVEKWKKNT